MPRRFARCTSSAFVTSELELERFDARLVAFFPRAVDRELDERRLDAGRDEDRDDRAVLRDLERPEDEEGGRGGRAGSLAARTRSGGVSSSVWPSWERSFGNASPSSSWTWCWMPALSISSAPSNPGMSGARR